MRKTLRMRGLAAVLALTVGPTLLQAQGHGQGDGGKAKAPGHAKTLGSEHSATAPEDSKGKQPQHPSQGDPFSPKDHGNAQAEHSESHADVPTADVHGAASAPHEEHRGPASRRPGWNNGKKAGWGGGDVPPGVFSPAGTVNRQSLGDAARQLRENKGQAKNPTNAPGGQKVSGQSQGGGKGKPEGTKPADNSSADKPKSE